MSFPSYTQLEQALVKSMPAVLRLLFELEKYCNTEYDQLSKNALAPEHYFVTHVKPGMYLTGIKRELHGIFDNIPRDEITGKKHEEPLYDLLKSLEQDLSDRDKRYAAIKDMQGILYDTNNGLFGYVTDRCKAAKQCGDITNEQITALSFTAVVGPLSVFEITRDIC